MRKRLSIAAFTVLALASACSDEPTGPTGAETITLSASQAATIVGRIESFASADPALDALADTVGVVINAGAAARRVTITTESGASAFYAISLHRTKAGPSAPWSTFHVIAFNDPATPTEFVILGGYASATSGDAPSSVSGDIGAAANKSLTAHIFRLSGGQLAMWHANAGTVSFAALEVLEACSGFAGPGQCVRIQMEGSFNITGTVPGQGASGQRTASGTLSMIPGIRISD
jgi:hypothetical protein